LEAWAAPSAKGLEAADPDAGGRTGAVLCLALLGFLNGCGGSSSSPSSPSTPSAGAPTGAAKSYLDELIGVMQSNSINRYTIDWAAFRQSVYQAAGSAGTVPAVTDTGAISQALHLLGDHHSFYMKANGSYIYNPDRPVACGDPAPTGAAVPASIGYVQVGGFSGTGSAIVDFAVSVQDRIRSADSADVRGWIVDLRGNGGGNMWPMIAGLGPVLGEGITGAFIDPDGKTVYWGYANGASTSAGAPLVQVPQPYQLLRASPRVAVLTDCRVASSGEATVIAFRGRPNARSFGTPTAGLSTANSGILMSDGAWLYLTVSVMADRSLTRYGQAVVPDEVIGDPAQTVQRAIEWLLQ
jgi:carboxyl-terminal processing protease